MASIQKRGKKYCVIYRIYDDEGKAQQKWETYDTEAAAKKRKLEVEYKLSVGTFEVPKCVTVKELLDEYGVDEDEVIEEYLEDYYGENKRKKKSASPYQQKKKKKR